MREDWKWNWYSLSSTSVCHLLPVEEESFSKDLFTRSACGKEIFGAWGDRVDRALRNQPPMRIKPCKACLRIGAKHSYLPPPVSVS